MVVFLCGVFVVSMSVSENESCRYVSLICFWDVYFVFKFHKDVLACARVDVWTCGRVDVWRVTCWVVELWSCVLVDVEWCSYVVV